MKAKEASTFFFKIKPEEKCSTRLKSENFSESERRNRIYLVP